MKILFGLIAVMLLLLPLYSYGEERPGQTVPYGTICPLCGEYGYCPEETSREKAVKALEEYYKEKGLRIAITNTTGRFIEADVYDSKELVDKVVLDRRTGRIRSIY